MQGDYTSNKRVRRAGASGYGLKAPLVKSLHASTEHLSGMSKPLNMNKRIYNKHQIVNISRSDLRHLLFWASYGIGKCRDGEMIDEALELIRELGKEHNVSDARNAKIGKWM